MYKVSRKCDQKEFAIKVSKLALEKYLMQEKQYIEDEIIHMKKLNHPFIVKNIDDFVDSAGY